MDKHELLTEICKLDKQMTGLAVGRNNYFFGQDKNSIGEMLDILSSIEGDAHPTDLCHIMGVSTPRVTVILNMMEDDGLIERVKSPEDGRKIIVRLTEKGKEKIQIRDQENYYFFEKVYEKLELKDFEAYLRCLRAARDVYEEAYKEIKQNRKARSKQLTNNR